MKKKNPETFEFICSVLNGLASNRCESISLTAIIENIRRTSPKFWSFFGKCQQFMIEKVREDPLLLKDKLSFLFEYQELIDFSIRSYYFRKIMKNRIQPDSKLKITVDFDLFITNIIQ